MITSKDNDKLKLIRKLAERKHREREGLFVTEGEDLYSAGITAGHEPHLVLCEEGTGLEGEEVPRDLLDAVATLGSGTRQVAVWGIPNLERPTHSAGAPSAGRSPACVYLHGIGDPGNVGAIVRTTAALSEASVVLGPGCADPFGPKAVRASMGSIFAVALTSGAIADTSESRVALVASGGDPTPPAPPIATLALGGEREGLPPDVVSECAHRWTIPIRTEAAESLNVAAAAAIGLERIASAAATGDAR